MKKRWRDCYNRVGEERGMGCYGQVKCDKERQEGRAVMKWKNSRNSWIQEMVMGTRW